MASSRELYFLVERYVPSTSAGALEAATARLLDADDQVARHVFTLLVPGEDTCLSVFEAPSVDAVAQINQRADFPLDRIVEVRLLTPPR